MADRKPSLVASAHVKTGTDENYAQRFGAVEAFATLFVRDNRPLDGVIRETLPVSRNPRLPQAIYGAWAAVDTALHRYGYEVTAEIGPTQVKRIVTGNGKAEKAEVAAAVRRLLGLAEDYRFATDDESDAAAVVLAYLIANDLIDKEAE